VHLLISEVEYMHGRSGGMTRTITAIFWTKVHALDWGELHHQNQHPCMLEQFLEERTTIQEHCSFVGYISRILLRR